MAKRQSDPEIAAPYLTAASYWRPPVYVSSGWIEHAPFASFLVEALRPRTVVELGTHNGYSLYVLAQAARRTGSGTRLWAVDSWEGDDQAGFYGDDVLESVRAVVDDRFPDSVELVRGYFADVVDGFADGSVDLLHIDGRHGYHDVKEDWEHYAPKLSDRGVAIFHDTHEFQDGFGVHRFWDELAATGPSFSFHHGHGLGVFAPGPETPAPVTAFLEFADTNPDVVRDAYAGLGKRLSEEAESVDDLRVARDGAEYRLQSALAEVDRLNDAVAGLRREKTEILRSTSWRLSSPVRVVGGLFHPPSRRPTDQDPLAGSEPRHEDEAKRG